jgi:hypothetical protein
MLWVVFLTVVVFFVVLKLLYVSHSDVMHPRRLACALLSWLLTMPRVVVRPGTVPARYCPGPVLSQAMLLVSY